MIGGGPSKQSAPGATSASVADQQTTRDALRRQVAVLERQAKELQQQVASARRILISGRMISRPRAWRLTVCGKLSRPSVNSARQRTRRRKR